MRARVRETSIAVLAVSGVAGLAVLLVQAPLPERGRVESRGPAAERASRAATEAGELLELRLREGPAAAAFHEFEVHRAGPIRARLTWTGADELEVVLRGRRRAGLPEHGTNYRRIRGASPLELSYSVEQADLLRGVRWRLVIRDPAASRAAQLRLELVRPRGGEPDRRDRIALRSGMQVFSVARTEAFRAALAETTAGLHGLVQLRRSLRPGELRLLERRGLRILGPVGGAFRGHVAADLELDDPLVQSTLGQLLLLEPEDKVDPALLEGDLQRFRLRSGESWVETRTGSLRLVVGFQRDVAGARQREVLGALGLAGSPRGSASWSVDCPRERLLALATADEVAWVLPASPPLRPTMELTRQELGVDGVHAATISPASNPPPPYTISYAGITGTGVSAWIHETTGTFHEHQDLSNAGGFAVTGNTTFVGHATAVAGIVGADGSLANGSAYPGAPFDTRGIAPGATLLRGDEGNLGGTIFPSEYEDLYALHSMDLANHSHTLTNDGDYDPVTGFVDDIIAGTSPGTGPTSLPPTPQVWSAGNTAVVGHVDNLDVLQDNFGFFSLGCQAKNAIVVGNWDLRSTDPTPDGVRGFLRASSSMGPTHDGRIKPDLVAPGTELRTITNVSSTALVSGTSFAAPVVTGLASLMLEAYDQTYNQPEGLTLDQRRPFPSTLRAVLIQTAQDVVRPNARGTEPPVVDFAGDVQATPGPDFATGWGLVDGAAAVQLIQDAGPASTPPAQLPLRFDECALWEDQEFLYVLDASAAAEVKATLAWDDYPDEGFGTHTALKLVNDLDLDLFDPGGTQYQPWVLNQTTVNSLPAAVHSGSNPNPQVHAEEPLPPTLFTADWAPGTGEDHLNNVEQVVAPVGANAGTWLARVRGTSIPIGVTVVNQHQLQTYSLATNVPIAEMILEFSPFPTGGLPLRFIQRTASYDIVDAAGTPVTWDILNSGFVVHSHFDDARWDGELDENVFSPGSGLVDQLFPDTLTDDPQWVGLVFEGLQVDVPFGSATNPVTTVTIPELAVGLDEGDVSMGMSVEVNTPASVTLGGFQVELESFDISVGVRPATHANGGQPFAALTEVAGNITFPPALVSGPNGEPISLPFDLTEVVPQNGNVMLCLTTDQELAIRLADAGVWLRIPVGTTLAIDLDATENAWTGGCPGAVAPPNLDPLDAANLNWRGVYIQSCTALIPMGGECLEVTFNDVAIGEVGGLFSLAGQAVTGLLPPGAPLDVLGVGVQFNAITVDFGYSALDGVQVALTSVAGQVTLPEEVVEDAGSPGNPVVIDFTVPGPVQLREQGLLLCFTSTNTLTLNVLNTGVQLQIDPGNVFALDLHQGLNPWSPDPNAPGDAVCVGALVPVGLTSAVPSWKGVYFSQLDVILPLEEGNTFTFTGQHLAIGTGGLSGRLTTPDPQTLVFDDFTITITSTLLEFTNSSLTSVDVSGEMNLPYFDEILDMRLVFSQGGVWRVDVASEDGISLAFPPGTTANPPPLEVVLRRLAFGKEPTGGFVELDGSVNATSSEATFGVDFCALRIDGQGRVTLAGGRVNLPQPVTVEVSGGFDFELRALGFGADAAGDRFISLHGDFNFPDILPVKPAGEDVRIFLEGPGAGLPEFPGIEVDAHLSGVGHIKGKVVKTPGHFEAELEVTLDSLGMTVAGYLLIGKDVPNNYTYWYVQLGVQLPTGIPLSPVPIAIYGFEGAFGKNVAIQISDGFPRSLNGIAPAQGALTLMLGLTIGTLDNGYTFNGDVRFLLTVPGPTIAITGDAWVATARTARGTPPPFQTALIYGNNVFSAALTGNFSVNNNDNLVQIQGSMELYFSPSEWHLYFGRKEPPHRLKATALTITGAEAYFMVGNRVPFADGNRAGLLTGGSIGWGGSWKKFGFGITAEAHVGGDLEISVEPLRVGVVADLGGKVELCIFGACLGISLNAQIVGRAPDPFGIRACVQGCIKLLFTEKCLEFAIQFGNLTTPVTVSPPDPITEWGFRSNHSDDQVVLSSNPGELVPLESTGFVKFRHPIHATHASSVSRYDPPSDPVVFPPGLVTPMDENAVTRVPPPTSPVDGSACEIPPTQVQVRYLFDGFDLLGGSGSLDAFVQRGWGEDAGRDLTGFPTIAGIGDPVLRAERLAERMSVYSFAVEGREELWDTCMGFSCIPTQAEAQLAFDPTGRVCDPAVWGSIFVHGALRADCDLSYFVDVLTPGLPSSLDLTDGVVRPVFEPGQACAVVAVSDAPSSVVRLADGKLLVPFRAVHGGAPPVGCNGAPGANPILFWVATDNGIVDCGDPSAAIQNYRREWRPLCPDSSYTLQLDGRSLVGSSTAGTQTQTVSFTTESLPEDLTRHVVWTSPADGAQAIYPGHQVRLMFDEPWLLTLFDQPGCPTRRPLRLRISDSTGNLLAPLDGSGTLLSQASNPHDDDDDFLVLVESALGPTPVLERGGRYTVELMAVNAVGSVPDGPARFSFTFSVSDYPDMRHLLLAPELTTEWQPEPPEGGGTTILVQFGHDVDWSLHEAAYLLPSDADTDPGVALGHVPLAAVENCGGPPHSYRFARPSGVPDDISPLGIANPDGSDGRVVLRPYATSHASAGMPQLLTFSTAEPLDWLHVRASITGAPSITVSRESPDDATAHSLRLSAAPPPGARLRLVRDGDSGSGPIITSASGPVCEQAELTIVVN